MRMGSQKDTAYIKIIQEFPEHENVISKKVGGSPI
jgi:hypothetical protein